MLLANITVIALVVALPLKASFADSAVVRAPACSDRSRAIEVYELLASDRQAEAREVFGAGIRARKCRLLNPGEIVAILSRSCGSRHRGQRQPRCLLDSLRRE